MDGDGDAPLVTSAKSGPIPLGCSAGAVYTQHSGIVHLDKDVVAQQWVLSNTVTGEQVALDVPFCEEAFLLFDDHGMGCIASDDHDPMLVKHTFKEQLWITPDGEMLLEEVHAGKKHFSGLLQQHQQQWSLCGTTIFLGPTSTKATAECAYFVRPKAGQHMFWSLMSLVNIGSWCLNGKKPSTWLHKRLDAWKQLVVQRLDMPQSAVMDSLEYGCDNSDPLRQLPFVSGSTSAVLAIVSAMAFASTYYCGLKKANAKLSASCLLNGLLKISLHAGQHSHMHTHTHNIHRMTSRIVCQQVSYAEK